jgi:hypothetical protein
MRRRTALATLTGLICVPVTARTQISQRARQVRERRACEENLPACRPAIRAQLDAERRRIRVGLGALAVGVLAGAAALFFSHRRAKDLGGDSGQNGAK